MTTETLITDGANPSPSASAAANAPASPAPVDSVAAQANQQPSTPAAETPQAKAQEPAAQPEKLVPDSYEFKAPEGVQLDKDASDEFSGIAKDLKLSQEEAQKVADIGAKMAQKWSAKQAQAIQTAAAEWAASATADKEFGGDKLTESLTTAKKALDAFGTPELRTLLNDSRLGNHPEVIRFMVRAGKAISEDRMVTSGTGKSTGSESAAQRMYPNMNP